MLVDKPQEQPTTGPNTTLPSFALKQTHPSTSTALGIVECIITENNTLKHQIGHIETQLQKAQFLSSGLLRENQNLRSLYRERTKDIGKIIKTISIQCDERQVDCQHQCHLLQELNYATLKQIKRLDQEIKERVQKIQIQKNNVDRINQLRNEVDHDSLNKIRARINNGVSHQSIAKKKRILDEIIGNNDTLEKEINNLIVENSGLLKSIDTLKRSEEPQRHQITQEREQYETRLKLILEENKRYMEELNADKVEYENAQNTYRSKEEYFKQVSQKLSDQILNYQKYNRQANQLNAEKQMVRNKIKISIQKQQAKQNQLDQLQGTKADLIKNIDLLKKRKKTNEENYRKAEQTARQQTRERIAKLQKQIVINQKSNEEERKKYRKNIERTDALIGSAEYDVHTLDDQIEEYSNLVRQHPNPICQIERIQLMMRLKKKK